MVSLTEVPELITVLNRDPKILRIYMDALDLLQRASIMGTENGRLTPRPIEAVARWIEVDAEVAKMIYTAEGMACACTYLTNDMDEVDAVALLWWIYKNPQILTQLTDLEVAYPIWPA